MMGVRPGGTGTAVGAVAGVAVGAPGWLVRPGGVAGPLDYQPPTTS